MNAAAIAALANIVKIMGSRFMRFCVHNERTSGLLFFFITMARRNGEINATVNNPVMAFANHQKKRLS